MLIELVKKAYIVAYLQEENSNRISCYPLFRVDPDTFNSEKTLKIIELLKPTLSSSYQVKAVKKVQGYKLAIRK